MKRKLRAVENGFLDPEKSLILTDKNAAIGGLQGDLRISRDALKDTRVELHITRAKLSDLSTEHDDVHTQKNMWQTCAKSMYGEYQAIHEKNEKLVAKLSATMDACVPEGIPKKSRNMFDELKGCPLEESQAYR